jgi:hypothetical protein
MSCRRAPSAESKEASMVASMVVILSAQATFHKTDYYGIGKLVYANPRDGRGLADLYEVELPDGTWKKINLIDKGIAERTKRPIDGYRIVDITGDANGPFEPEIEFAFCLVPDPYLPGKMTHYFGIGGQWSRDTGGKVPSPYTVPAKDSAYQGTPAVP